MRWHLLAREMVEGGSKRTAVAAMFGVSDPAITIALKSTSQRVAIPSWVPTSLRSDFRSVAIERGTGIAEAWARYQKSHMDAGRPWLSDVDRMEIYASISGGADPVDVASLYGLTAEDCLRIAHQTKSLPENKKLKVVNG